jgi:hypothetical protein
VATGLADMRLIIFRTGGGRTPAGRSRAVCLVTGAVLVQILKSGDDLVTALDGMKIMAKAKSGKTQAAEKKTASKPGAAEPVLLSGGNPQIPKGYGDAPVQAYIAAMPDWKSDVGRRLDAIITRTVPGVRKAVKWNSPFYGAGDEDQGWFVSYHCFDRYIKVAFFRGAQLLPVLPVGSKQKDVRYYHIHEDDEIDEAQFAEWVKQASELPGERL